MQNVVITKMMLYEMKRDDHAEKVWGWGEIQNMASERYSKMGQEKVRTKE